MDITWFGRSCFRIKGKEAVVVTDPCPPDTGYSIGKVLLDNLDKIPLKHKVDRVVTVHDSCHVARLGTFDLTRGRSNRFQALPWWRWPTTGRMPSAAEGTPTLRIRR